MSNLIATAAPGDETPIEKMTIPQLKAEVLSSLGWSAKHLLRAGQCVVQLEKLGEDLSGLRIASIYLYRAIGCGRLLPEVIIASGNNTTLYKAIASLPIPDQRRIVDMIQSGKGIRITCGVDDVREVPVDQLAPQEIKRVFASNHIRDENEQLSFLRSNQPPITTTKAVSAISVDRKKSRIIISPSKEPVSIPLAELSRLVAQLTA